MIKGKTKSGFAYEIEEAVIDDMDILEMMAEIEDFNEESDITVMYHFMNKLLGKEQLKSLKEHVRDEKGRAPVSKCYQEVMEIFNGEDETKNS